MELKIVVISDTHNLINKIDIPEGDILIHAGDIAGRGSLKEVKIFHDYIKSLPHQHKIVIAGNHDFCFERQPKQAVKILTNCIYLFDQSITIEGLKFFGSPWSPWFLNWAFNVHRGKEIQEKWKKIPEDTDILITHGPPFGILDNNIMGENVGCRDLLNRVMVVQPLVHVFGHIHEAYGEENLEGIHFINASICTADYKPINKPVVFTITTE